MDHLLVQIGEFLVPLAIAACVVCGMLLRSLTLVVTTWSRERSRREIAAYVAEGSISPDQGERLMRAEIAGRREMGCG